MNPLKTIFRERNFRPLLKRNFITTLAILLIPMLIVFVLLILFFNRVQYSSLLSQADSSLLRLSAQTDELMDSLEHQAFSINYSDLTISCDKYVEQPLSSQKLQALDRLQDSLPLEDNQSTCVLFQSEQTCFLVTPQVAVTVRSELELSSYQHQYRRFLDLAQQAPVGSSVSHSSDLISFCSRSTDRGGITSFAFVDVQKSLLAHRFRESLPAQGSLLFLIDSSGSTIVTSDASAALSDKWLEHCISSPGQASNITYRDQAFLLLSCPSSVSDWVYVQLFPIATYVQSQQLALLILFIAFIAVLVGGIFLSLNISMRLYHPIQIITHLLHNPQQGTMSYYRTYCQKYDDMELILALIESSHFQKLAISAELETKSRKLLQAQNYAMAVQMNPHFIFNTLDCINWRVKALPTDTREITSAISDFSKIMRYALKQKGLVSLMEEMNTGRIYMRLRNTLSTSKILVAWDIDEAVPPDTSVPFLILQPLLENAVTHGLKDAQDGQIRVRCSVQGQDLLLEVEDNGIGFSPDKLEWLRQMLQEKTIPEDAGHIGLLNTHNRLRLSYGEGYGLQISSAPGRTVVSLHLPLRANGSTPTA